MILFLGGNHCIPLFHMDKRFIWLNETKKRINEFKIGYMINLNLNIKKAFKEQVETFMKKTFGAIRQLFIRAKLLKKKTRVLALIMFYDTRAYNPEKYFSVLSCVIYTIIKNHVCIDCLACQSKN